jgi:hypothetical protein
LDHGPTHPHTPKVNSALQLPHDATLSDAIYELEFRQAVEQGPAELDWDEGIPIEEVKAKIAEWAGK